MAKRTVAYRLPEDVDELMEAVTTKEGITTTDLVTSAIAQYISRTASEDPGFADIVNATAQRRLERSLAEIGTLFGSQVLEHLEIKLPE